MVGLSGVASLSRTPQDTTFNQNLAYTILSWPEDHIKDLLELWRLQVCRSRHERSACRMPPLLACRVLPSLYDYLFFVAGCCFFLPAVCTCFMSVTPAVGAVSSRPKGPVAGIGHRIAPGRGPHFDRQAVVGRSWGVRYAPPRSWPLGRAPYCTVETSPK